MSLESRPPAPAHSAGSQAPADPEDPHRERLRLLDDPVAIRALAHPVRLDLQSLIGHAGQITAADAARELGISHGLASHHLRQLAKYGFVEPVPGKDNRERPWRLAHTSTSWREAMATPEGQAAAAVIEEVLAERAVAALRDWLRRRGDWPGEWQQHTGVGTSTVYLTGPELAELDQAIEALIKRYVDERPIDDVAARPEGSVPVDITQIISIPLSAPPERS
jgi:DNA-binding MarR family transcriptional regulator